MTEDERTAKLEAAMLHNIRTAIGVLAMTTRTTKRLLDNVVEVGAIDPVYAEMLCGHFEEVIREVNELVIAAGADPQ